MITVTALVQPYDRHDHVPVRLEVLKGKTKRAILIQMFLLLNPFLDGDDEELKELKKLTNQELIQAIQETNGDGTTLILAVYKGKIKAWEGWDFIED